MAPAERMGDLFGAAACVISAYVGIRVFLILAGGALRCLLKRDPMDEPAITPGNRNATRKF